jgi:hypothetical protein
MTNAKKLTRNRENGGENLTKKLFKRSFEKIEGKFSALKN